MHWAFSRECGHSPFPLPALGLLGLWTIRTLFSWARPLLALGNNPALSLGGRLGCQRAKGQGLCFLVFILLTASISAYMGAALLEVLVTLAFLALRATHYYERLTRVNWPCLDFLRCVSAAIVFTVVAFAVIAASHEGSAVSAFVFSLILIAVFCFDAYKTYKAEMGSEQDPDLG
nr:PREDICTED: CKLF-like MARVEL transmembrane domain-containing protein 5 [Anolis carolinensis]|eukprot:XP_008120551.1 PREDICTED: CKLF-like MARVEL transmembrane domain-containing protein 5 [Anolis carolinensis]